MSWPVWVMAPIIPALTASRGRPTEERDRAGVGLRQSDEHVDRRRLAGAVGSEQGDGRCRVRRSRSRPRTARTAPKDFVSPCATMLSCSSATCDGLVTVCSGIESLAMTQKYSTRFDVDERRVVASGPSSTANRPVSG